MLKVELAFVVPFFFAIDGGQRHPRPTPKFEDLGPEAFGLPADTPWPPDATLRKKGPFDYGHWDKIVEDVERQEKVLERYEKLQKDPKYEYRDGQKMQVIYWVPVRQKPRQTWALP